MPVETEVVLQRARRARGAPERRPASNGRPAAERAGDARLHARPARRRQGRPRRPARVRRPCARAAPAGPGAASRRRTARRSASGTPRCAACRWACRRATRCRPGRSAWPSSGRELVTARQRVARPARHRASPSAPASSASTAPALEYRGEPPTLAALEARIDRDVERGATGLGPHLDEIGVVAGDRDLRSFGSQGEQRLAVLSLLLAEADLLARAPRRRRRCSCSTTSSRSSTPAAASILAARRRQAAARR